MIPKLAQRRKGAKAALKRAGHAACAVLCVFASLREISAAEPGMALVPGGKYAPLFRGEKDAKEIAVVPFLLEERPVTNGEFLTFVRENPKWQRSQVKRLFADERYLAHWGGDLDLGKADAAQPVTQVSWFAAKSFAAWRGRRLPTTVEWEFAASAGFTIADGTKDREFQKSIARWVRHAVARRAARRRQWARKHSRHPRSPRARVGMDE